MARRNRKKSVRKPVQLPSLPRVRVNWRAVLGLPLAALGVYGVVAYALPALDRPVGELAIEGSFQRVSALVVQQAVSGELERGFVSVDLGRIRRRVEALDWVDRVSVSRAWPDRIRIHVTEHRAAARWGETGLLNVRGELFTESARHPYPELPQLDGPPGSEQEVARIYLELRGRLGAGRFDLGSLEMDARGALSIELDGGPSLRLGRDDVDARLGRFFEVVAPALGSDFERADYVDLRYANGFAVGWRGDAPPPARLANSVEIPPRG